MKQSTTTIYMPNWIKPRDGNWHYAGWIPRQPIVGTFDDLVSHSLQSDHGERREVDYYPQGAVCWWTDDAQSAPCVDASIGVSGQIIVSDCPYCHQSHLHNPPLGDGRRMADCLRGEYIISVKA